MSFFPGTFLSSPSSHDASFHPLFRFLDDFEQHRGNKTSRHGHSRQSIRSFTPKFDVKELPDAYELHGDLPGIEQKDIEIEFSDVQTITITGRTEHSYTSGTPPAIEGASQPAAIEDSNSAESTTKPHKATVEDGDDNDTAVVTSSNNNDNKQNTEITQKQDSKAPTAKYWVSERSVGEFSRSFTFPVRVDQEAVTASMKNGVLTIVVPKAKKHEARKITIASNL